MHLYFLKFAINYRQIAKPNFYYDLDVLITDLKTMDEESALTRFDRKSSVLYTDRYINLIERAKNLFSKIFRLWKIALWTLFTLAQFYSW